MHSPLYRCTHLSTDALPGPGTVAVLTAGIGVALITVVTLVASSAQALPGVTAIKLIQDFKLVNK
jgi:hypothetical protein